MRPSNSPKSTGEHGQRGERIAVAFLQTRGYQIVATNWRCKLGEIDIVARKSDTLVFVEVRSRRAGVDAAFESITPRKRERLVQAIYTYLDEHNLGDPLWQVDVIAVSMSGSVPPIIEHVENALDW